MSRVNSNIPGCLARGAQWSLALIAVVLVTWAFARVIAREADRLIGRENSIELVVMHWSGGGGQQEDQIVQDALDRFQEEHPDIRIRRINAGDSGQYFTKLQTMMAAGEAPDVFYMDYARLGPYVKAGQLAQMDELLGNSIDQFYPSTIEAFRHDGTSMGQGPIWGVPKDFTTVGFYYNKDLLERAGVEEPSPGWTWNDFIESARAVGRLPGCTGAEFVTWPWILRGYLWSEGTDLADGDWSRLRITDEQVIGPLERLRSWRHDEDGTLARPQPGIDPASMFLTGRLGFAGPFGRWIVPTYREIPAPGTPGGFEWDFARLPRGSEQANVLATVAWSMSSGTEHPEESMELVRWLTSEPMQMELAELGLAIPSRINAAEGDAFIDPDVPPYRDREFLDTVATARVADWPDDIKFPDEFGKYMNMSLQAGGSLEQATAGFEDWWSARRESPLRDQHPPIRWGLVLLVMIACLVLGFLCLLLLARKTRPGRSERSEERWGYLLSSPWLIGFSLFMLFPVLLSLVLALSNWNGIGTLDTAGFVGLGNFAHILFHDETFWTSLKVTVYYVILAVPIGQVCALMGAVLLSSRLPGMGFFRAAWYLPSVLAGVGVSILWLWVFRQDGLLNTLLEPMLGLVGASPPDWFNKDAATWGVPAFALMSLWMVGASMMIYLAGLRGIPTSLYEAASIDRAGPIRQFFRITIPMLGPVMLFNGIMSIIGSFQVFTQAFIMTGGEPRDLTRFYVLNIYNQAFDYYEMGYASALAWILLVMVLLLTMLVMKGSSKFVYYEGLR